MSGKRRVLSQSHPLRAVTLDVADWKKFRRQQCVFHPFCFPQSKHELAQPLLSRQVKKYGLQVEVGLSISQAGGRQLARSKKDRDHLRIRYLGNHWVLHRA
eukprot:1395199-Amorphochlora_amoeboformis.AAC.1